MEKHNSKAFLVNTGWTGGGYGVGERMSIEQTRCCINAILNGSIHDIPTRTDRIFGFQTPSVLKGVPSNVCNPVESWKSSKDYYKQAYKLADMFKENFRQYSVDGYTDYTEFGPKA